MAEKTSGANAGREDLKDSDLPSADPFAELTRIMGFDPRRAEGGAKNAAQMSSVEEFSIDLERELIHEFGEDEYENNAAPRQDNVPSFEAPLPPLAANSDDEQEEAIEEAIEEAVAEQVEQPALVLQRQALDRQSDLMEAELMAASSSPEEEDVPVIKLSPIESLIEEPQPEVVAPVLADAEPADEAELEAEFNALLGNQSQHEILDTSAEQLAAVAQNSVPQEHAPAQPSVTMADAEDDLSVTFGFPEPEALDRVPEPVAEQAAQPEEIEEPAPVEAIEAEIEAEAEDEIAVAAEDMQPAAEVKAQEPAAAEEDDPFAMLAAMAQKYRVSEPNDSWRSTPLQFSRATPQINRVEVQRSAAPRPTAPAPVPAPVIETPSPRVETPHVEAPRPVVASHAPEIETVDVPDRVVAVGYDLDIPEAEPVEEPPVVQPVDDLDTEFNNLLQQMSVPQPAPVAHRPMTAPAPVAPRADMSSHKSSVSHAPSGASYAQEHTAQAYPAQPPLTAHEQIVAAREAYRAAEASSAYETPSHVSHAAEERQAAAPAAYRQSAPASAHQDEDDIRIDLTEDDLAEAFDDFDSAAMDDFDLDGEFEDDIAPAAYQQPTYQQPKRRGLLIAAIVGGVAILGVAGAVAMSMMGDAQGSAPELVKADQEPFKVRPENPGGATAPNQESKVYETVARTGGDGGPTQETLISNTEEPVDLPDQLPDNADDDVALAVDGASKSEDRIVPPGAEAAQSADGEALAVAPRKVRTMVVKPDGSLAPREEVQPQTQDASSNKQNDAAATPVDSDDAVADAIDGEPDADQAAAPVEVAQEQTASITPQPAVDGGWTMQIASESSEEAAKATYQKMLGRYGNVLEGKGVNIIKADVAGKGTFWRIRIPAESRDAAAGMCNSFKSAGGKCFVTKS
ncbi:MAG: SPOR domain-containing protein [Rhizobiaceae bacterium]|nr:SPOR domain-containing protein [Rhizobiaceae bacterium]